jgi:hypothetical protein
MKRTDAQVVSQTAQSIDFARTDCSDIDRKLDAIFSRPSKAPKQKASSMTVGIAVMCEGGRKVVVASDRMVSIEVGSTVVQTETDCIKFETINPRTVLLYTGLKLEQETIMSRVSGVENCSALELAEKLQSAFQSYHDDVVERMLRRVGSSLKALGEEAVRRSLKSSMTVDALKNTTNGQFLIAGADTKKSFIYTVGDHLVSPHDHPGFTAVGSGSLLAISSLAVNSAHKKITVEEAVCLACEAKRLAEGTYGVGRKTDVGIVGVDVEARLFPDETVEHLGKICDARRVLKKADREAIRRLIES